MLPRFPHIPGTPGHSFPDEYRVSDRPGHKFVRGAPFGRHIIMQTFGNHFFTLPSCSYFNKESAVAFHINELFVDHDNEIAYLEIPFSVKKNTAWVLSPAVFYLESGFQ